MSDDEKFDDIIRGKFAEKEFVFNEENWEKAEQKIDSSRRIRKFGKWAVVFTIGLFSGVALMFPFVGNKNETTKNEIAATSDNRKTGNEIAELRRTEQEKNVAPQPEFPADQKEETASPENKNTHAEHNSSSDKSKDNSIIASASFPEKANKRTADLSGKPKQEIAEVASSPKTHPDKSSEENNATASGKKKNTESKKENKNSSGETKPVPEEKTKSEQLFAQNIPDSAQKETAEEKSSAVTGKNTVNEKQSLAEQKKALNDSASEKTKEPEVKGESISKRTTPLDSSAAISQSNAAEQPAKRGLASANFVSIEGGADFILGWKYHDTLEGRGFNPRFGFGLMHCFNQKWAISSGLLFRSVSHLNTTKQYTSTTYDFGSITIDTAIETKSLYYVMLPLQLHYSFDQKNSISIGGSASCLVNSRSNVVVTSKDNFNKTDVNTTKQFGFMSGYSRLDAAMSVGYRRKVTEKFSVSASASYGLIDLRSNSFFGKNTFERNLGLNISVVYDLFQF